MKNKSSVERIYPISCFCSKVLSLLKNNHDCGCGTLVPLSIYLAKGSKLIDTEYRFVFGLGVIGE